MKLTTLTTTALLGAALVGSAQVADQQNQDTIDQANRSTVEDSQASPAHDRSMDQSGGRSDISPGQTATPDQDRSGDVDRDADRARTTDAADRAGASPDRSGDDNRGQGETFRGEIELDEVPADVRNVFNSNSMGGDLDGDVRHLTIDGKDVYVAKADQDEGEDLHIYATSEGQLLKTQQKIDLDETPEAVRSAFDQQAAGQDVDKVLKENRDGQTSYIAKIDRDDQNDLMVQVDESGSVMKTWEKTDD